MNAPIRTRDLTKTFRRTTALSGLTFEVPEDDVELVSNQTGVTKEKALETLKETEGDLAEAILRLS